MSRRGTATRSIGRLAIEASPWSTVSPSIAETKPVSRRMPVPELPTSMRCSGSRRLATPPSTYSSSPTRSARAPRAITASRVWRTSSPFDSPLTSERPSARAAISKARCEIDLSPGARKRPLNDLPSAGSTTSCVPAPFGRPTPVSAH